MQLIKLPDGSWLDPAIVSVIRIEPGAARTKKPRVLIYEYDEDELVCGIQARTNAHAQQIADAIAAQINNAAAAKAAQVPEVVQ